ncbi:hypothetical protein BHV42_06440 [Candidatus Melainabacteria bacterium MEL.A1]|jgi:transcriptional regulator, XRE family|nr:hypothetical protein BHV42_06440 [Candidatus Melainabacteria bacterium MEL.A1]CCX79850.1 transcriptional regulator XRE family [Clostridium sp. CAG:715]DAA86208.1 MAG TPA: XRE family transcriptional regulator [Candidatus Gastranaerophilales bacterium HUM_2]
MESIKILFGKRVKELRKQHSYTQERLAELVGIDTRNLIKIENGQTFPRANTLDKLIEVFSITPDEILKMGHLENIEVLKQKIIEKLNNDEKLVKMVYKLLF